jgi:mannose-6-phosphate isomerase
VSAPLAFRPRLHERPWGGRRLADYGKDLPEGACVGESWEVTDRPGEQSVVLDGPLAGRTLHELWTGPERAGLFGGRAARGGERFPLLVKLLDCTSTLSVQVHPPADVAPDLGGEPKTEMWYLLDAEPGAHLFAGLRAGVSREAFEDGLRAGEDVSALLHRVEVAPGDVMLVPSGRVHALGAGCLVVEVQQNSDTTYRVFDFNRPGLDGELRELHVPESLASIDWDDAEPGLLPRRDPLEVSSDHFRVVRRALDGPERVTVPGECAFVCVLAGEAVCGGRTFSRGDVFLVPAEGERELPVGPAGGRADVLVIELPELRRG